MEDLEMAKILLGAEVQEHLKESLVPLVLRVITKYHPAYKEFSVAVEHHLHHQYSAAMARKTEQVLIRCMWVVLVLYQVFILISRHHLALISITFQPFTKVVACTRRSDTRGWCAVFSVHISLHCPHDMNALNRLPKWRLVYFF